MKPKIRVKQRTKSFNQIIYQYDWHERDLTSGIYKAIVITDRNGKAVEVTTYN